MFHIILILPFLIIAGIMFSIMLCSIATIVVSIVGGASTAVFVKNKLVRKMLFIGFCIVTFGGLICLMPFLTLYMQLSELFLTLATLAACACVGILAMMGMRCSATIQNKLARTVFTGVYGLILVIAVLFVIAAMVLRGVLV